MIFFLAGLLSFHEWTTYEMAKDRCFEKNAKKNKIFCFIVK